MSTNFAFDGVAKRLLAARLDRCSQGALSENIKDV
jgi:hypothetical protein